MTTEFSFDDEKFASIFIRKALDAGVRFNPEQVLEMALFIDKPILSRTAELASADFSEKEPFKYQNIVDTVMAKLKEFPDGTETSTSQVMEKIYGKCNHTDRTYNFGAFVLDFEEYCNVDLQVLKQSKKAGLLLDISPWEGLPVGLPFHCPYIVKHK